MEQENTRRLLDIEDGAGMTPLMLAASAGKEETVEMLLVKYKVSANQGKFYTPLFLACQNGHFQCAKLLCEAGADTNFTDKGEYECAPLH